MSGSLPFRRTRNPTKAIMARSPTPPPTAPPIIGPLFVFVVVAVSVGSGNGPDDVGADETTFGTEAEVGVDAV